jgi:hypothetical protein
MVRAAGRELKDSTKPQQFFVDVYIAIGIRFVNIRNPPKMLPPKELRPEK